MSFSKFGLHPDLVRATEQLGFTQPTPIQEQAIAPAMAGRDVMACAMTGSGKTAAFLLPIAHRLLPRPRGATRALILSPTRELAAQIDQHFTQLTLHTRLTGVAVFGGVAMAPQEQAFRRGVDVVIATPGRLLDHMKQPYVRFDALEVLVLDEADRMLDMGFLPDIKRVLRHLPAARQTMFFSATMPSPIVQLSREMLHDPVSINLERKSLPATGIYQAVYLVNEEVKAALFLELVRRGTIKDAIVFTRTKHRANRLADVLERGGVRVARIHGNRSQAQRTLALEGFKKGEFQVLVATDIVARGIDVEELSHVVNFDVPHQPEDYIHRVGRTARAEATGDAFTFVSREEENELRAIERAVGRALPRLTAEGFDYTRRGAERFEVPIKERIAAIRARKADERKRSQEKVARRTQRDSDDQTRRDSRPGRSDGQGGRGRAPVPASRPSARPDAGRPPAAGKTAHAQSAAAHAHAAAAHAHAAAHARAAAHSAAAHARHAAEATPDSDDARRSTSGAGAGLTPSRERVRGAWSPTRDATPRSAGPRDVPPRPAEEDSNGKSRGRRGGRGRGNNSSAPRSAGD